MPIIPESIRGLMTAGRQAIHRATADPVAPIADVAAAARPVPAVPAGGLEVQARGLNAVTAKQLKTQELVSNVDVERGVVTLDAGGHAPDEVVRGVRELLDAPYYGPGNAYPEGTLAEHLAVGPALDDWVEGAGATRVGTERVGTLDEATARQAWLGADVEAGASQAFRYAGDDLRNSPLIRAALAADPALPHPYTASTRLVEDAEGLAHGLSGRDREHFVAAAITHADDSIRPRIGIDASVRNSAHGATYTADDALDGTSHHWRLEIDGETYLTNRREPLDEYATVLD